jgi:tetraacyldisaccharide 4'-kinase
VVVLDDGFQHRRLRRDLDLVLVAAEQPYPSRLLPAGPYREGPRALARAGLVAVTRRTASDAEVEQTLSWIRRFAPDRPLAVLRLDPSGWTNLEGAQEAPPAGNLLAVASVAEPSHFSSMVANATGGSVELLAYPDHHDFTEADARDIHRRAQGRSLVVTEKDAVKLTGLSALLPPARVLTLAVRATRGLQEIDDALAGALRSALKDGRVPGPMDGPGAGAPNAESETNPSAAEPREQRR